MLIKYKTKQTSLFSLFSFLVVLSLYLSIHSISLTLIPSSTPFSPMHTKNSFIYLNFVNFFLTFRLQNRETRTIITYIHFFYTFWRLYLLRKKLNLPQKHSIKITKTTKIKKRSKFDTLCRLSTDNNIVLLSSFALKHKRAILNKLFN